MTDTVTTITIVSSTTTMAAFHLNSQFVSKMHNDTKSQHYNLVK